jgi:hypothetical protein
MTISNILGIPEAAGVDTVIWPDSKVIGAKAAARRAIKKILKVAERPLDIGMLILILARDEKLRVGVIMGEDICLVKVERLTPDIDKRAP